jgi:hypothetical protein
MQALSVGLIATAAVAGYQSGWDGPLGFVASDNSVRLLNGVSAERISTPDVERAIAATGDKDTLTAKVYTSNGNAFWAVSSGLWTWEYNVTTGQWNERSSYGDRRWRVAHTVNAFGRWVGASKDDGRLFYIEDGTQSEDGEPVVSTVESAGIVGFPNGAAFPRIDFRMVVGGGVSTATDQTETAPRLAVSWSDDGGATFGVPIHCEIGEQGMYRDRVEIHRTGRMTRNGRKFKVQFSDPVPFVFMGGEYQAEKRSD